jgi:DNA-binding transcriptional ArsR family regulator
VGGRLAWSRYGSPWGLAYSTSVRVTCSPSVGPVSHLDKCVTLWLRICVDVFAAVADPVRRRIVLLLTGGPHTAGGLADAFPDISRPAVSRHLRVLREVGLITADSTDQTDGRERHYRLNSEPLQEISRWIATAHGEQWEQRLDAFETEVHRTRRERRTTSSTSSARSAG